MNFSFGELLVVIIVALLVLGPKQLPVVAEYLGKWLKFFRGLMGKIENELKQQELQQKLAENEARAKAAEERSK